MDILSVNMNKLIVFSCLLAVALGAAVPKRRINLSRMPVFPNGRIVGGTQMDISEVPYQLSFENDGFQFCGASIISDTWAVTAGHCTDGFSAREVQVRSGSNTHEAGGKLVQVKRIVNNPQFDSWTLDYDVALLQFAESITGPNAAAIALTDAEPSSGDTVLVSGWGATREGGNTVKVLRGVEIPVVHRDECSDNYGSDADITKRMFCAGEAGRDSCQGDSGGPVAFNGKLAGIVSWGLGCARPGYPGVYTNVDNSEVRDFIRQNAGV